MEQSTVTAFIGVIGSGKDYRANALSEQGHKRIDFKDALLDMASDIAGYDVRGDYEWFKAHAVGVMRPSNPLAEGMLNSEWFDILRKHPDMMTGRKLLTRLGTEGMRKRDEEYWAKQWEAKTLEATREGFSVVTADCRFLNEVARVRGMPVPAKIVFCNYKSERYDPRYDHASERLAQDLLALGLGDGQEIELEHFLKVKERPRG